MFGIAAAIQSNGLTMGEVIRGIPHDGPAIVIYLMLIAFAGFVWAGSRRKPS
jgi:hypothetical protein